MSSSLPSLARLSLACSDLGARGDRQLERDLRMQDRLLDWQERQERRRRLKRRILQMNRIRDSTRPNLERASQTEPQLTQELIDQLRALDHEVRRELAFHPLNVQDASLENARGLRFPEVDPDLFEQYDEMQLFPSLRRLLADQHMEQQVRTRVDQFVFDLPTELKLLIISNPVVQSANDWRGVCNMIQTLCSTSRVMCDEMWPLLANKLLTIPWTKPDHIAWRVWVKHWCVKLNAKSPWARNLQDYTGAIRFTDPDDADRYSEFIEGGYFSPPDDDRFDFDKEECIWRLKHAKPTLFGVAGDFPLYGFDQIDPLDVGFWPDDPAWMAEALRHDGRFMSIAPDEVRNDPGLVRLGCSSHTNAMMFASLELQSSVEFVRSFMFSQPDILRFTTVEQDVDPQLYQLQDLIQIVLSTEAAENWETFDEPDRDFETENEFAVIKLTEIDENGTLQTTMSTGDSWIVDRFGNSVPLRT